jgi:hypothetical protein
MGAGRRTQGKTSAFPGDFISRPPLHRSRQKLAAVRQPIAVLNQMISNSGQIAFIERGFRSGE